MSKALTRADVERLADVIKQYIHEDYADQLLAHDAVQQARIAALEQEIEGAEFMTRAVMVDRDLLQQQLATLTAERDQVQAMLARQKESA